MTITELEVGKINPFDGGTQFKWTFYTDNTYPVGRWMGLMMKSMLGTAFENSQSNIKTLLEKK